MVQWCILWEISSKFSTCSLQMNTFTAHGELNYQHPLLTSSITSSWWGKYQVCIWLCFSLLIICWAKVSFTFFFSSLLLRRCWYQWNHIILPFFFPFSRLTGSWLWTFLSASSRSCMITSGVCSRWWPSSHTSWSMSSHFILSFFQCSSNLYSLLCLFRPLPHQLACNLYWRLSANRSSHIQMETVYNTNIGQCVQ